jgi:hypothetical protein
MRQVYVVTAGEYDAYRICRVVANFDEAEAWVSAQYPNNDNSYTDDWRIEVHTLLGDDPENGHLELCFVDMERDGAADCWVGCDKTPYINTRHPGGGLDHAEHADGHWHAVFADDRVLRVRVMARSEEHALEIVDKMRLQLIASGEWEDIAKIEPRPPEAPRPGFYSTKSLDCVPDDTGNFVVNGT